jgi:hypothetical protein
MAAPRPPCFAYSPPRSFYRSAKTSCRGAHETADALALGLREAAARARRKNIVPFTLLARRSLHRQDFGLQSPSRLEAIAQHANEKEAYCNHATIMFRFAGDRESNGLGFRKRQQSIPTQVNVLAKPRPHRADPLKDPACHEPQTTP